MKAEPRKPRQIRMTEAEWAKCMALGGAKWVRSCIEKGKLAPLLTRNMPATKERV